MQWSILDNAEKIKTLCTAHNERTLFAFGSVCTDRFNNNCDDFINRDCPFAKIIRSFLFS
jgi:hypothetical protein